MSTEIKFSEHMMNVLKNFQDINPSIAFRANKPLQTVSISRKILAIASHDEVFPSDFGIYELQRFFNAVSLFSKPTITVEKHFINIRENKKSLNYITCDPRDIITPSDDLNLDLPVDVSFTITDKMIRDALKAAGILGQPNLIFEGDGEHIYLSTQNIEKPTNEAYKENVGDFEGPDNTFKIILNVENVKLLRGDYKVGISFKAKIVKLQNDKMTYFLAAESKSQVSK